MRLKIETVAAKEHTKADWPSTSFNDVDTLDFENYMEIFNLMDGFIKGPDLLIYLRASVSTLVDQIEKRGRDYENSIRLDYLTRLNERYEAWIGEYKKGEILIIDVDNINFAENKEDMQMMFEKIDKKIGLLA